MTTELLYQLARTRSELLNHIKSRKLQFFGHIIRQPSDNTKCSVMTGLVGGKPLARLRRLGATKNLGEQYLLVTVLN